MPSNFNRADVVVGATRTQLYPASGAVPAGTSAIAFSGLITNIDDANKAEHFITLEIQKADSSYVVEYNAIPVAYGGSLKMPKLVLLPGERLFVKGEVGSVLQASMSIVERT